MTATAASFRILGRWIECPKCLGLIEDYMCGQQDTWVGIVNRHLNYCASDWRRELYNGVRWKLGELLPTPSINILFWNRC